MGTRYSSVPQETSSICSNWRPWPIRFRFLLFFVILCLVLVAGLEVVIYICSPDGCPLVGKSSDGEFIIPDASSTGNAFIYVLLPTVLAVFFGLLCAVIHHDCMRMEPWFQLSKPEGAVSEDSLFLEYSYMFPPFVLFVAAKKRHFSVFGSSFILLLSSVVLTPMTAGIFDDTRLHLPLTKNVTYPVIKWPRPTERYPDIEPDVALYSASLYQLAYLHVWFNSSLPAFTTEDYALEPWDFDNIRLDINNGTASGREKRSSEHQWTGPTLMYEADLECEEADRSPITVGDSGILGYNLTSSLLGYSMRLWDPGMVEYNDTALMLRLQETVPGFSVNEINSEVFVKRYFSPGADYNNLAFPIYDWATNGTNSSMYESAVYIWASGSPRESSTATKVPMLPLRWTAVVCVPRYYQSNVNATVLMPSGAVQGIDMVGKRIPLDTDIASSNINSFFKNFNDGYSEYGLGSALISDTGFIDFEFGALPESPADSSGQSVRRFGGIKGEPRVRSNNLCPELALYSQSNDTLETLFKPEALAEMYRSTFKLVFAMLSTDRWLRGQSSHREPSVITADLWVLGFGVNKVWCRCSQGVVIAIAMLAVLLMVLGRQCHLDGEPNSLASALAILHRSPALSRHLEQSEFQKMKSLRTRLANNRARYHLVLEPNLGPRIEVIETVDAPLVVPGGSESAVNEDTWPTNFYSGVFFASFFISVAVLAVSLYASGKANKGIFSPAPANSFRYKILFSYLPTLLGTIVEPLLVTLGSYYCMFGPYTLLHRGRGASSKKSVSIDYDQSPPHFQIFRSVRSGDFTLGGLTVSILLSNVLSVALSGIFTPDFAPSTLILPAEDLGNPRFKGNFSNMDGLDMHYTLSGTLSGKVKRPNWTADKYYILPFTLNPNNTGVETITARTVGLGAEVDCSYVPATDIISYCVSISNNTYTTEACPLGTMQEQEKAVLIATDPCWPRIEEGALINGLTGEEKPTLWTFPRGDDFIISPQCPNIFFVAWMPLLETSHNNTLPKQRTTLIRCSISHESVHLTATVDSGGGVLGIKDVVPLSPTELNDLHSGRIEELTTTFLSISLENAILTSSDSQKLLWYNSHLATFNPQIKILPKVPDKSILPKAFEEVSRRLYAMAIELNWTELLEYLGVPRKVEAKAVIIRDKVDFSTPMFVVAIGILLYTTVVVLLLYWGPRHGKRKEGHAPTCMAAMWSHLYASNAKGLCGEIRGANIEVRLAKLDQSESRFTYGEFTGEGGGNHVGVFIAPISTED